MDTDTTAPGSGSPGIDVRSGPAGKRTTDAATHRAQAGRPRRRLPHARTRVALIIVLGLVPGMEPLPAAAAVAGGSVIGDPWAPLAAMARRAVPGGWDCAGLPREDAEAGGPVTGTVRCAGPTCTWDLDDGRLDGTTRLETGGPCVGLGARATPEGGCPWGPMTLRGAGGAWVGSWSRAGMHDRLVVLAGTDALAPLLFVGRWRIAGVDRGDVVGVVTRDRGPVQLLWPMPIL